MCAYSEMWDADGEGEEEEFYMLFAHGCTGLSNALAIVAKSFKDRTSSAHLMYPLHLLRNILH